MPPVVVDNLVLLLREYFSQGKRSRSYAEAHLPSDRARTKAGDARADRADGGPPANRARSAGIWGCLAATARRPESPHRIGPWPPMPASGPGPPSTTLLRRAARLR